MMMDEEEKVMLAGMTRVQGEGDEDEEDEGRAKDNEVARALVRSYFRAEVSGSQLERL